MKSGIFGGAIGSMFGLMVGAAAFRAGTPVDARFTYQGQIREGDALVSGDADIRFTLWDAETEGNQVATEVLKSGLQLTDGRFATELDFGLSAFSGDTRWIQMDFRHPSGVGDFLALNPRSRLNAVPYALHSLSDGVSPWALNIDTGGISYLNGRVGVGTSDPQALLEVVHPTGGDNSVRLPNGSIGRAELDPQAIAGRMLSLYANANPRGTSSGTFTTAAAGVLVLNSFLVTTQSSSGLYPDVTITIDGQTVFSQSSATTRGVSACIPVSAGAHTVSLAVSYNYSIWGQIPSGRLDGTVLIATGVLPNG